MMNRSVAPMLAGYITDVSAVGLGYAASGDNWPTAGVLAVFVAVGVAGLVRFRPSWWCLRGLGRHVHQPRQAGADCRLSAGFHTG